MNQNWRNRQVKLNSSNIVKRGSWFDPKVKFCSYIGPVTMPKEDQADGMKYTHRKYFQITFKGKLCLFL